MIKKAVAIIALLVIVTVSVAGCTVSNNNQSPVATSEVAPSAHSNVTTADVSVIASNSTTAAKTANVQSYSGPFVGSKDSNVYHYPWCPEAKKIQNNNLITFKTLTVACADKYHPCEVCKPPACGATPSTAPSVTPTSTITPVASERPLATATPSSTPSGTTSSFTILYFHEIGCPYCAAFESTPGYAQLAQQPGFTPVVSTDSSMNQQYGVSSYPTVILLKNGAQVGRWGYPIDTDAILAQIHQG